MWAVMTGRVRFPADSQDRLRWIGARPQPDRPQRTTQVVGSSGGGGHHKTQRGEVFSPPQVVYQSSQSLWFSRFKHITACYYGVTQGDHM